MVSRWLGRKLSLREQTLVDKAGANLDSLFVVQLQYGDACPPDRRETDDQRTLPAEMPRPFHTPGIEKADYSARYRIDSTEIRAFMEVATVTSQRQIGKD